MIEPTNQAANYWKQWQDEMNSLCHQIYFNTDAGKRFLEMIEQRYFYAPVADPSVSMDQARFNEGRNNFIRGLRVAAYNAMNAQSPQTVTKETDYEG